MKKNSENIQLATARFDHAFLNARKKPPATYPHTPLLSSTWPKENREVLEQYQEWLYGGGTGTNMVEQIYVPTAGYTLGLNPKPYTEWNLITEFELSLDYINARGLSDISTNIRCNALRKFNKFLRHLRGEYEIQYKPINIQRYCEGLPDWLVDQLTTYQHILQANWRKTRIHYQTMRFWYSYTKVWRWLFANHPIKEITDIKRQHIMNYIDHQLQEKYAVRTINADLRCFRTILLFLQDQDYRVSRALLRMPGLKEPDQLPRFLTDEQVSLIRDDLEKRVSEADTSAKLRDARLDRSAFYLLWQGALRLGEVEELRLEDLDLPGGKLIVRRGKGQKDRTVFLTKRAVKALQDYLDMRGIGPTDHVFFYRNLPVSKDLIGCRIRASGKRTGVKVTPHRLRHTCATQLLNAGCRITSIQKLLGHRCISTTMVYAKVHDQSVSDDYYTAMERIEARLQISTGAISNEEETVENIEDVSRKLLMPQVSLDERKEIVSKIQRIINSSGVGSKQHKDP